jgi:hypothetical protein
MEADVEETVRESAQQQEEKNISTLKLRLQNSRTAQKAKNTRDIIKEALMKSRGMVLKHRVPNKQVER